MFDSCKVDALEAKKLVWNWCKMCEKLLQPLESFNTLNF